MTQPHVPAVPDIAAAVAAQLLALCRRYRLGRGREVFGWRHTLWLRRPEEDHPGSGSAD